MFTNVTTYTLWISSKRIFSFNL